MPETSGTTSGAQRGSRWAGWVIAAGFVGLAVWLGTRPDTLHAPLSSTASFDRAALTPRGLRTAMKDPATTNLEGTVQRCDACHFKDQPAPLPPAPDPHGVVLNHGMNNWCFNCHDAMDRQRLALQDTTTVAYADVPVLCAQCHGTTYRDWQKGMHGKSMGSWDEKGRVQRRLLCTECHNPHSPAYGHLAPLPGPNTLRMGAQGEEIGEKGPDPSPLRHWRRGENGGAR